MWSADKIDTILEQIAQTTRHFCITQKLNQAKIKETKFKFEICWSEFKYILRCCYWNCQNI